MATDKQIAANRRNAMKSTGPKTEHGKLRARQNAFRHGLTAETVVTALEDADDYARFEEKVTADFDPQTAVECQLVLRVAALLWRLRRALAIESGLFQIQGRMLHERRSKRDQSDDPLKVLKQFLGQPEARAPAIVPDAVESGDNIFSNHATRVDPSLCFLRLTNLSENALERVSRYETRLWRQLAQTLLVLRSIRANGSRSLHNLSPSRQEFGSVLFPNERGTTE